MARQLRIEVTFLAALRQAAGRDTTWLELAPPATVGDALALLRERMPQLANVPMVANVNGATASPGKQLAAGDGLYLLPPD
jgi:molybdopterin converting factor small subunit